MITVGNLYFHPQIACIEKHFGFSLIMYWGNNNVSKYMSFNLMFINLTISLVVGEKK